MYVFNHRIDNGPKNELLRGMENSAFLKQWKDNGTFGSLDECLDAMENSGIFKR
jgi:hypothetical protein